MTNNADICIHWQLERLKDAYGDVMLIPGQRTRLSKADDQGLIYVPGCVMGYANSKRILQRWKHKAEQASDEVEWWIGYLKEHKTEPIFVSLHPLKQSV